MPFNCTAEGSLTMHMEGLMQVAPSDLWSSVHRTLIDVASLMLLAIGLARIILHDLKSLKQDHKKSRPAQKSRRAQQRKSGTP